MKTRRLRWHTEAEQTVLAPMAFETRFEADLENVPTPLEIRRFMGASPDAPLATSDDVRKAVRDALRGHGYKPTGRGKPASEYLLKAVESGRFSADRSINVAVDACNAVSLHSGLPISVIDLERTTGALTVTIAPTDTRYVFNPSGQTIVVDGLWCLFDDAGVCASPVKDSQRTKTHPYSRHTLSILWCAKTLAERGRRAQTWYRQLLGHAAAETRTVAIESVQTPFGSR